ncbi:hypothetical protein FRC10_010637 [Ceratobasidium sp. 414]|nr:hypothetical protein FRC10_010637 [Ceratobasidium sp. 414]
MIIDKAPLDVTPQTSGPSFTPPPPAHNALNPLATPAFQTFSPAVLEQSPRMSDDGNPDYAPPPYDTVVVAPPPRVSTGRLSKRSLSTSSSRSSPSIGELDLTVQEKARICPRNPAEHISPCFLRPVPSVSESATTYERLPRPFVINPKPGVYTLEDSFATVGTPALYKHDVSESDWEELLGDVRVCARLSSGQRVVSGVLPVTRHLGPPGHFASHIAEQGLKYQKTAEVVALLDVWNEKFFKSRRELIEHA